MASGFIVIRRAHYIGDISFLASADHASVTSYTAKLYDSNDDLVDTLSLGKPTPDETNTIVVNEQAWLNTHTAGNGYYVRVTATSPGGESSPASGTGVFTIPVTYL